jgi:hypothetical protein
MLDLASVSEGEGDLSQAVQEYRRSMKLTARSGRTEMLGGYARAVDLALKTRDWEQISPVLDEQLVAHAMVPPQLRSQLILHLVQALQKAVFIGSRDDVVLGLSRIAARCRHIPSTDLGAHWLTASSCASA